MKKIICLIMLFLAFSVSAQRELWGVTQQTIYADEQGNIVKFDINGENAMTMHHFDYPTGKVPMGKLFLASNGKLYGTATFGGIGSTTSTYEQDGYGVLYEYDLIFDTYRVVHYFNSTSPTNLAINPTSSLIEPIPGKLYGGTQWGSFYVYDIATETVTSLNHNYSFQAMGWVTSDLIKASDNFVYAISSSSFPCTSVGPNQPNQGSIIKINTTTNTAQRVAVFGCSIATTINAFGGRSMVEALPNRIFFITDSATYLPSEGAAIAVGGIIEFNTATNSLTQKFTFDPFNSLGFRPSSFVMGDNGNLYGTCNQGGDTFKAGTASGLFNKTGTLFEYNPNTNDITKLTEFLPFKSTPGNIIKLTTGDLIGNIAFGSLFKYDTSSNTLQFPDLTTYNDFGNQYSTQNLLEICRKPTYHFFDVDTFDACIGGAFSYDVHNTNATSYQWLKDGTYVQGQTAAILNLTNLSASDAGNYNCEMTNECGTTTTMGLHLTVNCLGTTTFTNLDKSVRLYPNPTKDILNVKLPDNVPVTINNIKIVNSLGQIIREQKTQNKQTIDVSQLRNGIYIISLSTNYGDWNGKFMKE